MLATGGPGATSLDTGVGELAATEGDAGGGALPELPEAGPLDSGATGPELRAPPLRLDAGEEVATAFL
jgi:hypothetical protein